MKRMTKLTAVLMALVMCVSFAACAGEQGNGDSAVDFSLGLTTEGKYANINIKDYITLGDYTNLEFPAEVVTVSEEDIQEQVDAIMEQYPAKLTVTDRAVADGDTVNIDYTGYVDGVAFENGSTNGAGTDVIIGQTNYIDDFIAQLVGHMPGETFDIEVTFPDPYENDATLAGKDATFTVTINHIMDTYTYELTDQFVTDNLQSTYGFTSVADMKEQIEKALLDNQVSNYLWETVLENATVSEVPENLVENEFTTIIKQVKYSALNYGIDFETMLTYNYGVTDEATLRSTYKDTVTEQVQHYMLVQAIAEDAGLVPTAEEVEAYFTENDLGITFEDAVKQYGKGYLARAVLTDNVSSYLLEQNPTTNVAPGTSTDLPAAE